jgi:nucleoside diphosphate kinase
MHLKYLMGVKAPLKMLYLHFVGLLVGSSSATFNNNIVFTPHTHTSVFMIVGPNEVEIAKHVRPNTIRAKFGSDKVKNAVHCTDLVNDGILESEYFFYMMIQ